MKIRRIFTTRYTLIASAFVALCSCNSDQTLFHKVDPAKSGVDFENRLTPNEDLNIIDYLYFYNGGGIAVGDINGDDLPDLYFSGNQVPNKLYLNKGGLKFEDITEAAGVQGNNSWSTGSVMADVNGDGLLDIYVCAVVGLKNLRGHNELFINNGDNTFTERAADFGLDFETYSSSAAFLDYDLDGDLDLYLLNHAIHTPESFGHADLRKNRTYETGGKLLNNSNGKFVDVSEEASIYGGVNSYGLGVAISDFNLDGYPDIYVGNDFHEDDYFYINNRDGTFSEVGKVALTAMSKFSMGNDVADINHDGLPDLVTLDMLPTDEALLKRSVDEESIGIQKLRTEKYGYNYQFPRNMLQVNLGNGRFAECALLSKVAATDWSWSALFADFDQDSHQDLFVSNGIPRRPNDLDYIKYVSSEEIVKTIGATRLADEKALSMMPSGEVKNVIFRGNGNLAFEDKSDKWLPDERNCSTAAAFADLDNDGDLDLVVNNVDQKASIYSNQLDGVSRYLKIKLRGKAPNTFGIGSKVYSYHNGIKQVKELYTARGFQSSSQPIIHFGYDKFAVVDSIKVVWPGGQVKVLKNIKTNQTIEITFDTLGGREQHVNAALPKMFERVEQLMLGLNLVHKEDNYTDFDRLKLLPYQQSDRGPATAVGDINDDGKHDIFFGGSKHMPSQIYIQSGEGFKLWTDNAILHDSVKEDIDAVIADFDKNGSSDLFIGTGGADFYGKASPLTDSYYRSVQGTFTRSKLPEYFENASCVRSADFDGDGDIDLFIGNQSVSDNFGAKPTSYLLRNDGGNLNVMEEDAIAELGMVTDAVWSDFDKDGILDLVVVGEWMEPVFLRNTGEGFAKVNALNTAVFGLWQSISSFDIDNDGDEDFILGNWGLNSKFKASKSFPMKMYYDDFDGNGKTETIVAIEKDEKYYPLMGLDQISSQIPSLRKKFTTYSAFAGQELEKVIEADRLSSASLYEVNELSSGWLENVDGEFKFSPFPIDLQVSPIMAQLKHDFDSDGREEVLLGGNYFGVQPFHGRFGSFPGAIIKGKTEFVSGHLVGLDFVNRSVRNLNVISVEGVEYLLVTLNNDAAHLYKLQK